MAVIIQTPEIRPEQQFQNVFLELLEMRQAPQRDNTQLPVYALRLHYRLYAVDENNVREFDTKGKTINIGDYLQLAAQEAAQGNTDLLTAIQSIEAALAVIISNQSDLGQVQVI